MNFTIIGLIVAIAVIVLAILYKKKGSPLSNQSSSVNSGADIIPPSKKKVQILTYKEAFEASKQFIYDITKLVMQKFSPPDKKETANAGAAMAKAGVEYLHVVDVLGLSIKKQKDLAMKQNLTKDKPSQSISK